MSIDQNPPSADAPTRSLTVRIGLLVVFVLAYWLSTWLGLLFNSRAEGIAVVWPAGIIGPGMVMTIFMIFWAIRVYKLYGSATLAPEDKVVI